MRSIFLLFIIQFSITTYCQNAQITGIVSSDGEAIPFAKVNLLHTKGGVISDMNGAFTLTNLSPQAYILIVTAIGFNIHNDTIVLAKGQNMTLDINLIKSDKNLNEVVISGTMKPMSKLDSPVPVEVYTTEFFKSNPSPSVYEALSNVNGVRPQVNCSVCNTGDIHINGLEGPYTMILIDGMPIVSGLSTVYGLSGIPQSLIERVEIVKGPASTLYGSEAVGGLVNIITKAPTNAPLFSADAFATSWGEINADLAGKIKIGKKLQALIGVNYFNFNQLTDNNNDNFTDLTQQNRISIFNKWNLERKDDKLFTIAGRYVYEDRWGGELDWTPANRGGDKIYGESIYTNRWEVFGTYQLPIKEAVFFNFSMNQHKQNSVYGDTWYIADQRIAFGQFNWNKKIGRRQELLSGVALRYTYYDDNTPATSDYTLTKNQPSNTILPGIFVQDEISLNTQNKILLGMRYDYNSLHGNIYTPRINYKWNSRNKKSIIRISGGSGYRVANVFTEDHAALTGAREIVFLSDLNPETSWNGNLNMIQKVFTKNGLLMTFDFTAFYTYFDNKIFADYDTNPNQIIYDNLDGHAISNGISLNIDISYKNLTALLGGTAMEVYSVNNSVKERQELTEQFTGTWTIGYKFPKAGLKVDYTGNLYGPMDLPTLGSDDPRPSTSPWWSIQNIQVTKTFKKYKGLEIYAGVKNLLNWTPWKNMNTEMIARAHDPFDKNVSFADNGDVIPTANNPYGLTFDPAYVYAPNQGIRAFLGLRFYLK
ncbi:TonB-dependent receptor [Crocinitomix catalasitica]|uniref:TonB-dependent receptor n=1 Tax=Crocinitomix catalasitica TaxID=184607 RepID=UPI0004875E5B|nr:TonB-dependent receptor [Crocinitomix catalasitica]